MKLTFIAFQKIGIVGGFRYMGYLFRDWLVGFSRKIIHHWYSFSDNWKNNEST